MCCVEPDTVSSPERDIKAVLDESGPDYETFTFERPTAGHQGEVFLVTLRYAGQEYEVVVKFQAGDPGFALEPFLHEYVADRTDIPVPRILVFEEEPELDIDAYFVTERISGDNLAESIGELEYGLVSEWVNGLDSLQTAMSDPELVEEEDEADAED
jgi:hypothetical protein